MTNLGALLDRRARPRHAGGSDGTGAHEPLAAMLWAKSNWRLGCAPEEALRRGLRLLPQAVRLLPPLERRPSGSRGHSEERVEANAPMRLHKARPEGVRHHRYERLRDPPRSPSGPRRENRRLLAVALERMSALESQREPRGAPERGATPTGGVE